ncbi:peptidase, M28 family, partial [Ancylostoma duodenale]
LNFQDVALQLIFFDGEEAFVEWTPTDSLYGSRHLAKKWESKWYPTTTGTNFELSREIDRIDVMMLLDLIGARNPGFHNSVGLGANQLFLHLPAIGIPILHLISVPFPRVWHTDADNEKALHYPTIYHVTSVIRVFVAKYLGIAPL